MFRKLILAPSFVLALLLVGPLVGCSKDKTDVPTTKDQKPKQELKQMTPGTGDKSQPKTNSE